MERQIPPIARKGYRSLPLDPVVGMLPGERREIDRIRKCDRSFAKFSDECVLAILRGMCAKDAKLRARV